MLGQCGLELNAAVVRVAVDDVGGPLNCRADTGQRAEYRLVAGEFDRTRHRLAWDVNWEPGQHGTQAGTHFDSICRGCCTLCLRRFGDAENKSGNLMKSNG